MLHFFVEFFSIFLFFLSFFLDLCVGSAWICVCACCVCVYAMRCHAFTIYRLPRLHYIIFNNLSNIFVLILFTILLCSFFALNLSVPLSLLLACLILMFETSQSRSLDEFTFICVHRPFLFLFVGE